MEDFVSFEIAKKLKEKGFSEECLAYYTSEYTLYNNEIVLTDDKYLVVSEIDYEECLRSYNTQKDRLLRTIVDAPTISQVLKWLREEKKIHVNIDIIKAYPAAKLIYWGYNIVLIDKYEVNHSEWNSNSFEQAALAGIEYVIDNLM